MEGVTASQLSIKILTSVVCVHEPTVYVMAVLSERQISYHDWVDTSASAIILQISYRGDDRLATISFN